MPLAIARAAFGHPDWILELKIEPRLPCIEEDASRSSNAV